MSILFIYLAFYGLGLAIGLFVSLSRIALFSGVSALALAVLPSGVLYGLTEYDVFEPWLVFALITTVFVPAALIGFGLLAAWGLRKTYRGPAWSMWSARIVAALPPIFAIYAIGDALV